MRPSQQDDSSTPSISEHLKSAVLRSRKRLMPFLLLMYVISFLDRTNIGFAKQALEQQAGIGPGAYALGAGLFFITYAIFEIPSNLLLYKVGAKVWMARIMVTWGLVSMATLFVAGRHSFYALRLLLGAAEAGFFPGVVLYLTYWFPDQMRASVFGLFYFGAPLAFIFGSPISGLLLQMNPVGSLKNWQWMFLVEGSLAVLVGIWSFWYLDDGPAEAKWLLPAEKAALEKALSSDDKGVRAPSQRSWTSMLRDRHLLQLSGIYCLLQMSVYGVVFYLPNEISALLHRPAGLMVGLVTAVPWICALIGAYLLPLIATIRNQRRMAAAAIMLAAAVASYLFPLLSPIASFTCISIAAMGLIAVQPLFWTMPTQYLSGRSAAAGLAAINAVGALGGFAAPTIKTWADHQFHSPKAGLLVLATTTLLTSGWIAFLKPGAPIVDHDIARTRI